MFNAVSILASTFVKLSACNVCSNSIFVTGAGINLSSLLIKEGRVCWDLYIDGLVISSDGNLLDALSAAIKVVVSHEML